jgi:hypothetical protein
MLSSSDQIVPFVQFFLGWNVDCQIISDILCTNRLGAEKSPTKPDTVRLVQEYISVVKSLPISNKFKNANFQYRPSMPKLYRWVEFRSTLKNSEVKNPKAIICVVLCVIYNNIMHLIIILTT